MVAALYIKSCNFVLCIISWNILHKFNVTKTVVTLWSGIKLLMFWWNMLPPPTGGGGGSSCLENISSCSVSSESSDYILSLFK